MDNKNIFLAKFNVNYLSGFLGYYSPIRNVLMAVFSDGLVFSSTSFKEKIIPFSEIYDFKISKGIGLLSSKGSIAMAIMKPDFIIDILFDNNIQGKSDFLKIEMANSKHLIKKNELACQELIKIMQVNNIFSKFKPLKLQSPEPDSVLLQIKKLAELHQKGILTDEEFQSKKTELLKKI